MSIVDTAAELYDAAESTGDLQRGLDYRTYWNVEDDEFGQIVSWAGGLEPAALCEETAILLTRAPELISGLLKKVASVRQAVRDAFDATAEQEPLRTALAHCPPDMTWRETLVVSEVIRAWTDYLLNELEAE